MNGFDELSTSDLTLCANLLYADAAKYDRWAQKIPKDRAACLERSVDRRALADRLISEAERRGKEMEAA